MLYTIERKGGRWLVWGRAAGSDRSVLIGTYETREAATAATVDAVLKGAA